MILVFGGGGQLGQELVAQARRRGVPLAALGRAEADIAEADAVARAIGALRPSLVVNAAAYNAVDRAESEGEAAERANARGPELLARAAAAAGLPLIHVSTDYVFSGDKRAPYVEDDPVAPLNVYGRSKAEGEAAVRGALADHFILRTAWVFGAYANNMLRTVLRLAAERDELAFVADQTGSPTASADLATAILAVAATPRERRKPGTYHVAGAPPATRHALASAIVAAQAAYTGRNPPVRPIASADHPTAARRPVYSALDSGKFAAVFGCRPGDWRDGVREAVAEIFSIGSRR